LNKVKGGKKHHSKLHILELLSENLFVILKNKVHPYKRLKEIIDESENSSNLNS